ncbi:MAG TPA: CapA family protein [Phycisphaerae bacterium]|nr:CapA family protein [Phycisphaerae bacterium]
MTRNAVTFGAVGDINFSGDCAEQMMAGGIDWPFEKMLPHLRRADVLFGNMESVLLPPDYPDDQIDPKGLVGKYDGTPALAGAGFGFMNLANNHVLDGGRVSMFHTRDAIERLGVVTAGVGKTQKQARQMPVLQVGGLRFGFLCYCEDSNYSLSTKGPCHAYYTRRAVLSDVARNKDDVDVLVVSIHADLEFMETPSWPRREIFREISAAGATIVLGHHPHVPQGVELIDGRLIAYSLGNFYFAAHSDDYMKGNGPHTAHSFLLLAEVGAGGVESFARVPFEIRQAPEQRPVPLDAPERERMLAYLEQLDRKAADDEAVKGNWRDIALRHLDIYLERVRKYGREDLLVDLIGRLVLVAENRSWIDEVFAAVKENWARQARRVDPCHRPQYAMTSRKPPGDS